MKVSPLGKSLKPDRYQVFLMASPASLPLSFATHPWFVLNKKGTVSRWGVGWRPQHYKAAAQWGHIANDSLPLFQGLRILYFTDAFSWKGRLLGVIEGDETSIAARMINCIECSPETYPFRDRYSFLGPNSNTYIQWVLDQFPESGLRLRWNSLGKGFKYMTEKQLWEYFSAKKVAFAKPFDRDFVWIRKADFQSVKESFVKEFNFMHRGDSFRSRGLISHIHAVDQEDYMFVHPDMGNLARFLPLGLIHLFLDVIPYLAFALIKGVSLESLFILPSESGTASARNDSYGD